LDQYHHILHQLDQQKGDGEDWNMFQMCLTLLKDVGKFCGFVVCTFFYKFLTFVMVKGRDFPVLN
jgi:hypothetical protein